MIVSTSLVAVMMMGLIPAAHAGGKGGHDEATAIGGPGGKGAPSLNVGVCLNLIVASCDDVASGNSGGGAGGGALADA